MGVGGQNSKGQGRDGTVMGRANDILCLFSPFLLFFKIFIILGLFLGGQEPSKFTLVAD